MKHPNISIDVHLADDHETLRADHKELTQTGSCWTFVIRWAGAPSDVCFFNMTPADARAIRDGAQALLDAMEEVEAPGEQAAPAAPPIIELPLCPACDGSGVAQEGPPVILCELCDGSGIAHPDTAALWRLAQLVGTMEDHEELRCPEEGNIHALRAAFGGEPPCRQHTSEVPSDFRACVRCWIRWARAGEACPDDLDDRARAAGQAAADRAFGQPEQEDGPAG